MSRASHYIQITRDGVTRTIGEWARELGIPASTIAMRYSRNYPDPLRPVAEQPLTYEGETLTYAEWAERKGTTVLRMVSRIHAGKDPFHSVTRSQQRTSQEWRVSPEYARARREVPWELDLEAQRLVAENPNGMCIDDIAAIMGVSRETVRLLEHRALRKLRLTGALTRGGEP